jgi:hypothetical protein
MSAGGCSSGHRAEQPARDRKGSLENFPFLPLTFLPCKENQSMRTLPVGDTNIKAYRATLRDEPGTITKLKGELLFFHDTGEIVSLDPEDCMWLCVLGELGVSEAQALADARHGGAAWIASHRAQEVA